MPSLSAQPPRHLRRPFRLITAGIGILLASPMAYAEDPFPLDQGQWMSFDHYQEKVAHPSKRVDPPPDAEAAPPVPEVKTDKAASVVPTIAAPLRPVQLPIMPGINEGYDLQIRSTDDEAKTTAQISDMGGNPTLRLPEHNWQNAVEAAKHSATKQTDASVNRAPIDVRMTFLPDSRVKPAPSVIHESTRVKDALRHIRTPPVPKAEVDKAACEANEALKKKQIEALQSDRETLKALQDAITQLGVQKQLNFMTGADGDAATGQTPIPSRKN